MIIPWGTDAPIYHWPKATVGLIAANILAFVGSMSLQPDDAERLLLSHGHGLHPLQWITSNFIHGGVGHLIGNLIFLWAFGIVVEGKLGAMRFLAVYLGLGVIQSALEQVVMLGAHEGYSLGASAIIYGLMAICLVWAPENNLSCMAFFRFRVSTFELPIFAFALLYIGMELFWAALSGLISTAAPLHLMGVALGFALGTVMLRVHWVDCEDWDLYAVLAGRKGKPKGSFTKTPPKVAKGVPAEGVKRRRPENRITGEASLEARSAAAVQRLRARLEAGDSAGALAVFENAARTLAGWHPPEADLLTLIKALQADQALTESVAPMRVYVRRYPEKSDRVRLKLAQILIRDQQPGQALRVLGEVGGQTLPEPLQKVRQQLIDEATRMREDGVLELESNE